MEEKKTCGTCIWNDDLLCDKRGCLVNDDDPACCKYESVGQYKNRDKEEE